MIDIHEKEKLSLSGAKRTDNLSRIKKEAAEIFGSCFASPKMTEEGRCPKMTIQHHSEAEPKSPRKVQHNDWILHFAFAPFRMTIPAQALSLILTFGAIGESLAATIDSGTCVTNCNWVLDDKGNMKITGGANGEIGTMKGYSPSCVIGRNPYCTTPDRPWEDYREQIKSVDIQGITNVSSGAFYNIPIKKLTLGNTITSLATDAFEQHHLNIIELPDSLTTLGGQALDSYYLQTLIIPDTLNTFVLKSFNINDINIICRGESAKCNGIKNKMLELGYSINFSLADSLTCDTANFYWDGAKCVREPDVSKRKCCDSCKDMGGYCNRVRYTPAEAAAVLNDDNTVVLTFKK